MPYVHFFQCIYLMGFSLVSDMRLVGYIGRVQDMFNVKIVVNAVICKTFRIRVLITSI